MPSTLGLYNCDKKCNAHTLENRTYKILKSQAYLLHMNFLVHMLCG